MTRLPLFRRLRRDTDGAVLVEFALSAPIFLTLLFGVFQIGLTMWNYNALRGVAGEVSRWAAVQYQTDHQVPTEQIRDYAQAVAIQSPFLLKSDNLGVQVVDAATQRVAGATEKTLILTYRSPSIVPFISVVEFDMTHTRSMFLIPDA